MPIEDPADSDGEVDVEHPGMHVWQPGTICWGHAVSYIEWPRSLFHIL